MNIYVVRDGSGVRRVTSDLVDAILYLGKVIGKEYIEEDANKILVEISIAPYAYSENGVIMTMEWYGK